MRRNRPVQTTTRLTTVLLAAAIGLSGCAAASAGSPTVVASQAPAGPGANGLSGGGSNARSGPAAGGSLGTVDSLTSAGFTMTTDAGQSVTVTSGTSTTYLRGEDSAQAGAVSAGSEVLVLGTTQSTTIAATTVDVSPTDVGSKTSAQAGVVPFEKGTPSSGKKSGDVPSDYTEGQGTIVSGDTAYQATTAALATYPGGIVDRVVKLSDGDYEVHYIGVNWPHHIFLNSDLKVVGAY
jgi:hypothetical protein